MTYDHRIKAGNEGDVIKHVALIASLDTLIATRAMHVVRYADTYAGFPYSALQPGGEWARGAGAVRTHRGLELNPHVRFWRDRYLAGLQSPSPTYPGSSTIASDVAVNRGCAIQMSLWDTSVDAVAALREAFADGPHRIYGCAAQAHGDGVSNADYVLIDPPGLASPPHPEFPSRESIQALTEAIGRNVLVWLPLSGDDNGQAKESAPPGGLRSMEVCWPGRGTLSGCRLLYRFDTGVETALRSAVECVVRVAGWRFRVHDPSPSA